MQDKKILCNACTIVAVFYVCISESKEAVSRSEGRHFFVIHALFLPFFMCIKRAKSDYFTTGEKTSANAGE